MTNFDQHNNDPVPPMPTGSAGEEIFKEILQGARLFKKKDDPNKGEEELTEYEKEEQKRYPWSHSDYAGDSPSEREFQKRIRESQEVSSDSEKSPSFSFCHPSDQDWLTLEKDIQPKQRGHYTVNPETQHLSFENLPVLVLGLRQFDGKKLAEVADYVTREYSEQYYIPGREYRDWLFEHENLDSLPPDKSFEILKKELVDHQCYLLGSTSRDNQGRWNVCYVDWYDGSFDGGENWLDETWDAESCRVILLKRK